MLKVSFLRPEEAAVNPLPNLVDPAHDRTYWLLFIAIVAALVAPFWTLRYLPLVDLPHMIARFYILLHYDTVAAFQSVYEKPMAIVPNMGSELIALVLGRVFDVVTITRILLSIIVVAFAWGCHSLAKAAYGRKSWITLPVLFFVYSTHLVYGNINFLLTLSGFFLLFGYWYARRSTPSSVTIIVTSLSLCLLVIVHMAAYAFMATAMVIVTMLGLKARSISLRSAAIQLTPLLAPIIVLVIFFQHGGTVGRVVFTTPFGKIMTTLSLVTTFRHSADLVNVFLNLAVVGYLLWNSTRVTIHRDFFALGLAYYVLLWLFPATLFTSVGVDARFLVPTFTFLVLSTQWQVSPTRARAALVALLLIAVARVGVLHKDWRTISDRMAPQIAMWERLPEGARTYTVTYEDKLWDDKRERPLLSLGLWAVPTRHVYDPRFFALRQQQPLYFRESGWRTQFVEGTPLADSVRSALSQRFDYLWCYRTGPDLIRQLRTIADPVDSADGAVMLKIRKS